MVKIIARVSCLPRRFKNKVSLKAGSIVICVRTCSLYRLMYFCVKGPMGTKRCLSPLPVTLIKPSSKNKSEILSAVSSLTRSPQLYKVSIIARLRSPCGLLKSIAATMRSISLQTVYRAICDQFWVLQYVLRD